MAGTLVYPSNFELTAILQVMIPQMVENDPVLGPGGIFPIDTTEFAKVMWEQLDNFWGLTQLRGVGGQPGRVLNVGMSRFEMDPGYYGDIANISEQEMLTWRKPGDVNAPWDLTDRIMIRLQQLITNGLNRVRQVVWALLTAGTFSVASPSGVTHTDTFPLQTYATVHPWSAPTTSTPLGDYRNVVLLHRGTSARFDGSAYSFMNRKTFNYMDNNNNAGDLFGRRTAGLETVEGLGAINYVLTKDDLPKAVIYDEGYLNAANPGNAAAPNSVFVPFIPDNVVVVIGNRPGAQRVGKVIFTRNATELSSGRGGDGAGDIESSPYEGFVAKVVDHGERQAVGREIDLGLSFNFGPAVEYPSSIVTMNVGAGS
jgi:hypothetical protein